MSNIIFKRVDLFYRLAGGQKERESNLDRMYLSDMARFEDLVGETITGFSWRHPLKPRPYGAITLKTSSGKTFVLYSSQGEIGIMIEQAGIGTMRGDINQAAEKAVPHWAASVVRNYKEQFKAAHNRDTKLSDHQVFVCFNNRAEYETSEETDEGVVDDMFDKERALGLQPDNDFGPGAEAPNWREADPDLADLSDEERNLRNQNTLEKNWQGK